MHAARGVSAERDGPRARRLKEGTRPQSHSQLTLLAPLAPNGRVQATPTRASTHSILPGGPRGRHGPRRVLGYGCVTLRCARPLPILIPLENTPVTRCVDLEELIKEREAQKGAKAKPKAVKVAVESAANFAEGAYGEITSNLLTIL